MISPDDRERAEKSRSALAATKRDSNLLMPEKTVARYRAPPGNTIFPLEYAFHLLGDVNGKTILEYGCGDGKNTVALSDRGAKVIGLDLSPELLEIAQERLLANQHHETMLVLGSAHALPFPDESIDIIFGIAILHHLDLELASREIQRVLKKGGRGIFQEPLRNSNLVARVRRFFPKRADVSPFEHPLTDMEIKNFAGSWRCRDRTFELPLSRLGTFVPFWRRYISEVCASVDTTLMRVFPPITYYGSIKVFELAKD